MGEHKHRRSPVHLTGKPWIGNPEIQFVTVCAQDRKPILASDVIHHLLLEVWLEADSWQIGRYVLVPDHIHLFAAPVRWDSPNLTTWVRYWKSRSSQRWPRIEEQPVWQQQFWDTQIRGRGYESKWLYVRDNPVRAGLVDSWKDWPYQGELHKL